MQVGENQKMGILMKLADALTVLFLTIVTVVGLLTNAHVFLPSHYYLKYVIDGFIRDKKHYLLLEKPDFFRALLYYHLLVNWPLAVISLYGFIFRKSWIRTTSLILAVSFASITVPVLGELVGSGKGTAELVRTYFVLFGLAIVVIFCSILASPAAKTKTA